jgi:exodeoxyribonuclease V alpha subunit
MEPSEYKDFGVLFKKLANSRFRSRFELAEKELTYLEEKGLETIKEHACDFITKRLGPAYPQNDGKQTPMKNHPVFVAQHATATCCRKCLRKWHGIPKGRELTDREIDYIVSAIMHWIILSMKGNIRYNPQVDEDT